MTDYTREQLEGMLVLDRYALDDIAERHAGEFHQVAQQTALAVSRRDEAKQLLDEAKAKADPQVRKDLTVAGEKITEATVLANVNLTEGVKDANNNYLDLKREAALWEALMRSWEQRSFMISRLTEQYQSGYFSLKVGEPARREAEDKRYNEALDRVGAARRARRLEREQPPQG